jgi:hypothetical protein
MPDFGIFRGFNDKLFGDKLYAGQLPTQLGIIGSQEVFDFFGLLDLYPNAAAAYSLRKLTRLYTGSAIRVRRSSDNAEQNIGFANNQLDIADLQSFCSGTDGFVTTWYDQSGNGRNATQTTAVNQPQIVSSGSVITENNKPTLQFDGVNDGFTNNLSGSYSNYYLIGVVNCTSGRILSSYFSLTVNNFVSSFASTNYGFFARNASGTNTSLSGATTTNNQVLQIAYLTSSSAGLLINNNSPVTSSPSLGSIAIGNGFGVGRDVLSTLNFNNGKIQEAIIYLTNETSNTSGIQTNINSFYSIY